MRKAFQVLSGLLAAMVVVQAMSISYAMAGLFVWVDQDGGVLDKAALEDEDLEFTGVGGFIVHGIDGMMFIPLLALALLVVGLLANKQLSGAARRGAILFGLVVLQVVLGLGGHEVLLLAPLHALNGFAIFAMAVSAAREAGRVEAPAPAAV